MARNGRNDPVIITNAAEDPETELRRREIRYIAMMLLRVLCLIGAAVVVMQKPPLWQLLVPLCVVAAVLLPWFAVLLANDRPPKARGPARPVEASQPQPAIEPREYKVIDHD